MNLSMMNDGRPRAREPKIEKSCRQSVRRPLIQLRTLEHVGHLDEMMDHE